MPVAEKFRKVIIVVYLIALHGVIVWLLVDKFVLSSMLEADWKPGAVPGPSVPPLVTPTTLPSISPTPGPETPSPTSSQRTAGIMIPVAGVRPEQLIDTFAEARSEGRVHEAIDIAAPAMTPVVAAADGEIVRFLDSELGGVTIYQLTADRRYVFYYAHLNSRAAGIAEKQFVTKGTTIGYVGDTGNAGPGNYHLHFSINAITDPKRYFEGTSINPYPILTGQASLP